MPHLSDTADTVASRSFTKYQWPPFARLLLMGVLLVAWMPGTAARAQGCQSTADLAAEVWDEYGTAARNMGCATGGTGTAIVSGGIALPAGAAQYSQCIGNGEETQKLTEHMVEFYNENMGRDEWEGIGLRPLEPGTSEEGFSPASDEQHTFITAPLRTNEMKLELGRLSGLGKIDVTACTWLPVKGGGRAKAKKVWSTRIDGTGSEWSTNLSGLRGRILTVLLTPERVAIPMNRFKYRVSTPVTVPDQNDPMWNFTIEYGYDRAGSDYRDFDLDEPAPSQCQKVCAENDRCKAFTYVKPGIQGHAARCWLKDEVAERVRADGMITGVKETSGGERERVASEDVVRGVKKVAEGALEATTWTAVWQPGEGAQRWDTGLTFDELQDRSQKHLDNGLRLTDLNRDGDTFGAVWQSGSGEQYWRTGMSQSEFESADGTHFDNGLRLVDVEVQDDSYTAVWRAGSGAQWWHTNLSKSELADQNQEYAEQGLRLIDVEVDGGTYTAVWRPGDAQQKAHTDMTQDEFANRAQTYFEKDMLLADVEIDGETYTAVWKERTGGQWWRRGMSIEQFVDRDETYFDDGFRLIDMETPDP